MKIILADTAGFCMGVRRAVELALDAPAKYPAPIYTFGPLIHNPQVLSLFGGKGVTILDHIPAKGEGTVIIRAHGVPPETKHRLKDAGFKVIDATCPRVVRVQSIIKSHHRKGYAAIIIGEPDHPEVISLLGFAGTSGYVAKTLAELQSLPSFEQAIVVAQTTQNISFYQDASRWVAEHHPHYQVFDTICDSTEKRQAEVRRLAESVDAVIVVGGKESGNTRRLVEVAASTGKPAFHVETEAELDIPALIGMETIGITAGASTPTWIIKGVYQALEQASMRRWHGWINWVMHLLRKILLTNFFVALGAGCLCYAMIHLLELPLNWSAPLVAVLYVLSMHTLNHLTGGHADKYNEPEREKFYQNHKLGLTVLALAAGSMGLLAALRLGPLPFWTLLVISLLGLSYNLWFMPEAFFAHFKYRRIRDFPGSKTFLIALAWGVVTTGLPVLATSHRLQLDSFLAMAWATGLVFCRTAFFDVLDMQGDRIVGKETLPILLGTKATIKILKNTLLLLTIVIILAGVLGIFSLLAPALAVCPLLLWLVIKFHESNRTLPGIRTEFMVEGVFFLSGLLALAYLYIGKPE